MNATERDSIDAINASPRSGCLIWQSPTRWSFAAGGAEHSRPATTSLQEVAAAVRQLIDGVDAHAERCVLALPTTECFFANLAVEKVGNVRDRNGVTFELERYFPLDAEAMVADYTVSKSGDRIAAVCVESQRQRDVIEALETQQIDVASVIPATFLIARGLTDNREISGPFELVLGGDGENYESVIVDSDGVWKWRTLFGSEGLRQHMRLTENESYPLVLVGPVDATLETTRSVQHCDETAGALAVRGADLVLAGQWGRWIELRRGALAPADPLRSVATPLRWLALTAAVCFILISLAAYFRGQRISEAISLVKTEQRTAFKRAFPDRRVPIMLARTVRSEHRKALGARGKGGSIKLPVPATDVLRSLYAGLENATAKANARFRITDLSINDGECSLTVRARNSRDIGAVAKELESVGFRVQPPGAEQIEPSKDEPIATYESTINAAWIQTTSSGGERS